MKFERTIKPSNIINESDDLQYFKQAVKWMQRLIEHSKEFVEAPESPKGIANLAEATELYDKLTYIYYEEDAPFSYHSMSRLREAFESFKGHYDQLLHRGSADVSYKLGRRVETGLDALNAILHEWEQCVAFAEGTPR